MAWNMIHLFHSNWQIKNGWIGNISAKSDHEEVTEERGWNCFPKEHWGRNVQWTAYGKRCCRTVGMTTRQKQVHHSQWFFSQWKSTCFGDFASDQDSPHLLWVSSWGLAKGQSTHLGLWNTPFPSLCEDT